MGRKRVEWRLKFWKVTNNVNSFGKWKKCWTLSKKVGLCEMRLQIFVEYCQGMLNWGLFDMSFFRHFMSLFLQKSKKIEDWRGATYIKNDAFNLELSGTPGICTVNFWGGLGRVFRFWDWPSSWVEVENLIFYMLRGEGWGSTLKNWIFLV